MPRYFAIIPAAGHSSRMGQPKLLLPINGRPLILHTLAAWQNAGMTTIVIVVRTDDAPLVETVRAAGVEVVTPTVPPPDMKASIQAALGHIQRKYAPDANDAFLVAPADIPQLSPAIIAALVARNEQQPGQILVPTLAGRRGHPVLFPWPLADNVFALAADEGLNSLQARHPVKELACDALLPPGDNPFADIDTPEEYRAAGEGRS